MPKHNRFVRTATDFSLAVLGYLYDKRAVMPSPRFVELTEVTAALTEELVENYIAILKEQLKDENEIAFRMNEEKILGKFFEGLGEIVEEKVDDYTKAKFKTHLRLTGMAFIDSVEELKNRKNEKQ